MNPKQLQRMSGTKAQQDAQQFRAIANRILLLRRNTTLNETERSQYVRIAMTAANR